MMDIAVSCIIGNMATILRSVFLDLILVQVRFQLYLHLVMESFDGRCQDRSNGYNLIKTIFALSSLVLCKENCQAISDCAAVDYSSDNDCNLYRGGPYTHGVDRNWDTECHLVDGILGGLRKFIPMIILRIQLHEIYLYIICISSQRSDYGNHS